MVKTLPRQLHVAVVGAGFAGLRCADVLLEHGAKVTIFEARHRLGGRVAQSKLAGHTVDLGPNWIHGTDENPIHRLAIETDTRLHGWEGSSIIWNSEGKALSSTETAEYAALQWDNGLIADAFRYSNEYHDSIDPHKSLYDFFVEKTSVMFTDQPDDVAKRKRETFLQVASIWGAYIGSPFTRQSLKYFWLEECIEGENPFVAGTYSKILDAVARRAVAQADIHLNRAVTRVTCRNDSAKIDAAKQISIQTADGDVHAFDEIVMTAPLGWLKHNKAAFKPDLDKNISSAIDNIGYGTLDKVYITFPSAFWKSGLDVVSVQIPASDSTVTPNVTATITPLHQPGDASFGDSNTGFLQWLSPEYASSDTARWGQNAMNLAALPDEYSHPTLLFYVFGDCSKHIAHMVASAPSKQAADSALIDFMQPYFSLLPNYSAEATECKPTAVLATVWANDEYAGFGSYTNFQIGLTNADADIKALRHGMPEKGLWFAGEHTAPFVAMGTSTGAYWSGEAVAQRIVDAYHLKDS